MEINTVITRRTNDCHDNSRLSWRNLLQHGQYFIHDEPLVKVLEELADADESVDPDGQEVGADAQLLDAWKKGIFHGLIVK